MCCDTQRSKRADDGEILSEYSEEDDAPRKKKRVRKGSDSEGESGEEGGKKKTKKRRRYVWHLCCYCQRKIILFVFF